ncbi:threonine/serine exporter family protein [Mycolicibacterium elephantis]|uniref:threonine/serine ThrE exporter family protein n=1 Tax=Mycolicibacterium elephantis TaxID=81858 RepID=UPI000FE20692|nr:threonine/serine exporter family protein [Mycolicibacterium elephantis]MCV7224428.1 threonine/serine exporter family protein [Mycolicibacterium elephantis]
MAHDRIGGSARLRRGVQIALRGRRDPAPVAGQRRRAASGVDEIHARKVLDLTIRLAEVMLSSGSGTADVVATAQDVAQAYRLTDCVVDIFVTTVIVSALPTADSPPVTIVRSVHTRSTDYTRLGELDRLVLRITSGGVSVEQAHEAMDELTERPHPYPRWLATVGWAGFALGIAMLLGGTWVTCILAATTSAVIDQVGRRLNRIGTPFFFQHAIGAAIATLVAVAAYYFGGQGPTALVATGIVMLLSGLTFVGAMQDAVTGYMLTAIARLGEAVLLTAGIVVGILAGLQIATMAGVVIELHVDATESFVPPHGALAIALAVGGAGLAGASLTVTSYAPLRAIATAGLAAAAAEVVLISLGTAGAGQVFASGVAAVGVGVIATLISIRRQAPALVTATAGIMPMLPGLAVFRAVFSFAVDGNFDNGLRQMMAAIATALALGSGVVLGEFLGSPLRYRAGRIGDLLRKEGLPGLRRAIGPVVHLRPTEAAHTTSTHHPQSRSVALEPTPADQESRADGGDESESPEGQVDRRDGQRDEQ